jgi:copper chaperone CopZ
MKECRMTAAEFQVTGTCSHCEHAVATEVGQLPGVQNVDVSTATGRLVVTTTDPVEDAQVMAAVEEAGYQTVRST